MSHALPSARSVRPGIPACVTLAGMLCGYLSAAHALDGSLTAAAWLIVCSGLLDAVDGPLARALRASSDFGRELDSFADLVSFGVAPSLLFYRAYFQPWGTVGMLLSSLPALVAALRLTRFNISTSAESRDYFMGFTSTAGGNLLASFLLFSHTVWRGHNVSGLAAGLVVVCCVLMLSRIRYSTLTRFVCGGLWIGPKGALCLVVVLSLIVFRDKAFFPAMTALMLEGMLSRPIGQAVRQVGEFRRQHRGA